MLSKPKHGWSDFQLDNTSVYGLSYLDDIAFEWLDQAIHGLETLSPFCVKGFLEPDRFLCLVSYWNCHIICEDDGREALDSDAIAHEYSHTNMIEFCENLYNDISQNIDDWVSFFAFDDKDINEGKIQLTEKLEKLKELIAEKRKHFCENREFW